MTIVTILTNKSVSKATRPFAEGTNPLFTDQFIVCANARFWIGTFIMDWMKIAVAGVAVVASCGVAQRGWAQEPTNQTILGRTRIVGETRATNAAEPVFYVPSARERSSVDSNYQGYFVPSSSQVRFVEPKNPFESNAYLGTRSDAPAPISPEGYNARLCRFEERVAMPALEQEEDGALPVVTGALASSSVASDALFDFGDLEEAPVPTTVSAQTATEMSAPAIAPLSEASTSLPITAPSEPDLIVFESVPQPVDSTGKTPLPYPTKPANRVGKTRPINVPTIIPKAKSSRENSFANPAASGRYYASGMGRASRRFQPARGPFYDSVMGAITGAPNSTTGGTNSATEGQTARSGSDPGRQTLPNDFTLVNTSVDSGVDSVPPAPSTAPSQDSSPAESKTSVANATVAIDATGSIDSRKTTGFPEYAFGEGIALNEPRVMSGLVADVEYLGWQTELCDSSSISTIGSGLRSRLGFRAVSGWDIDWNYTYFDGSKTRASQSADVNLAEYGLELGKWSWRYDSGIRPFVGFQWSQLNQSSSKGGSKHDSYGIRFGAEWKRDLRWNFQAFARASGVVGVGQTGSQGVYYTDGAGAAETALGLAWRKGNFQARGGYEFNDWFNAAKVSGKNNDFMAYGWFVGLSWNH